MIRFIAFAVFFFAASAAVAERVVVRTDVHQDLTRVVFYVAGNPAWAMQPSDGGYAVNFRLEELELDFDRTAIAPPVPRLMKMGAVAEGTTVELQTGCDCNARAYQLARGIIVVDITGEPEAVPTSDMGPLTFLSGSETSEETEPLSPTESFGNRYFDRVIQGAVEATSNDEAATNLDQAERDRAGAPGPNEPNPQSSLTDQERLRLNQTRDVIVRELARAAAQGLLEPADELPERDQANAGTASEFDLGTLAESFEALPNARAETSIDAVLDADRIEKALNAEGQVCLAEDSVDVGSWGEPGWIYGQLGDHRSSLVSEFDRPDPEVVLEMSRRYIYATFGVEAAAVLDAFSIEGTEADVLRGMARIIDDGSVGSDNPFEGQLSCPSAAALWAALAEPALDETAILDRPAIVRNFSTLPLHLRRHLGPGLALRFLEVGDRETSFSIRNAIARAPGNHGERYDWLTAQISLDLGDVEEAADRFEEIAAADGAGAAMALVSRVEIALQNDTQLPPGVTASVAALAFEYRGTEEGMALAQAHVLANVIERDFATAAGLLLELEDDETVSRSDASRLWTEFAKALPRVDDASQFLEFFYRYREVLAARELSSEAAYALAERLFDLGLFKSTTEAIGWLADNPNADQRFLEAQAHFKLGEMDKATTALVGMEDDRAIRLLAEIALRQGRISDAVSLLTELGDEDRVAEIGWRTGDWNRVADSTADIRRDAANLMTGTFYSEAAALRETDEPLGEIAVNAGRLQDSTAMRDVVEQLLGAPNGLGAN